MTATSSDKVLAATLPLFSAWCAKYAWGWLAGLEVIAAAGLAAWKITNVAKAAEPTPPLTAAPLDPWVPLIADPGMGTPEGD